MDKLKAKAYLDLYSSGKFVAADMLLKEKSNSWLTALKPIKNMVSAFGIFIILTNPVSYDNFLQRLSEVNDKIERAFK